MTFAELKTELARRGFDYLTDDAQGRYINDAYLIDICEAQDWLWLQTIQQGTIPMTIDDLRSVLWVTDRTSLTKLRPLKDSAITDQDVNLETPGEPLYYYLYSPTNVFTYPISTHDFQVNYVKTPPALAGNDEPVMPERFHTLICDAAVVRAYEDDDEWDAAGVAAERFQQRLQVALQTDAAPQHDRPDDYVVQTWVP